MWLRAIAFCLLSSTASAQTGWRMVVYDGDRVVSADNILYPEQTCKDRAKNTNDMFKASVEAARTLKSTAPAGQIVVKCEPVT